MSCDIKGAAEDIEEVECKNQLQAMEKHALRSLRSSYKEGRSMHHGV